MLKNIQTNFSTLSCRSVGLPKVQSFCAFNPSRDIDIEVNSVFTSGRNFHVSPVHSMVSVDRLLETMYWMKAKTFSFLGTRLLCSNY